MTSGNQPGDPARASAPASAPAPAPAPARRSWLPGPVARVWREIAQFGVVGLAGVLVNLVAFALLRHHMQPVRAGVLATVIAIVFNYVGYRYWVYRKADKKSRSREITLFLVFSLIGLVIENGVLYLSIYGLHLGSSLEQILAKNVVGLGLGTAFRFWSYRTWVWRALPKPAEASFGGPAAPGTPDAGEDALREAEAILAQARARESAKRAERAARDENHPPTRPRPGGPASR